MMSGQIGSIDQFGVEFDETPLNEEDKVVHDSSDSTFVYYVENERFDKEVSITFKGETAEVEGLPSDVKLEQNGAYLKITSKGHKIAYTLRGKSENGGLHIKSDQPTKLELAGLDLKSNEGEAISVGGKSAVYVVLTKGSQNRLEDKYREVVKEEPSFPWMMAQREEGPAETETVNGITMKKAKNRSKDKQKSTVDGVLVSSGLLCVSGEGELWLKGHNKSGMKSKGHLVLRPGNVVHVEVTQGKGLSSKGDIRIYGGVLNIDGSSSGKDGIRSEESIYISGGRTTVKAAGGSGSEGIEAKYNIVVDGGTVQVASFDDGMNSGGNLIINGGTVSVFALMNDAIDANGNLVINGGTVVASGGNMPECGLDAAEEEGYELFVNGGTVVATGGMVTRPSKSSRQASVIYQCERVDSGYVYGLVSGDKPVLSYRNPRNYAQGGALFFSSPKLVAGKSYEIGTGASAEKEVELPNMVSETRKVEETTEKIEKLEMPYSQVGKVRTFGPPMFGGEQK